MAIEFTPDDVASGFNLTKLNSNFDKVETALQDALSRSGTGPNQMNADIDLNNNDLLNVKQIDAEVLTLNGDVVQVVDLATALKSSNALSEIAALGLQATARTNLGLGSASTHPDTDFATAAQGAKADTALQNNLNDDLFWLHDGAVQWRNGGRAFFGEAINDDGNEPDGGGSWPNSLRAASVAAAQIASTNTIGHTAVFGGSRTSDNALLDSAGTIGGYFMGVSNKTGVSAATRNSSYGLYIEGFRYTDAGSSFGFEVDSINNGQTAFLKVNQMVDPDDFISAAGWFAAGGEVATNDSSIAIGIVANGKRFNRGILFGRDSLVDTPLPGDPITFPVAIGMQNNYALAWFSSSGADPTNQPLRVDFGDQVSFNSTVDYTFVGGIKNDANKFTIQLKTNTPLYINGIQANGVAATAFPATGVNLTSQAAIIVNLDGTNFKIPIYL